MRKIVKRAGLLAQQVARDDLGLQHVFVVHPGAKSYPLADWCEAVGIRQLRTRVKNVPI